MIKLIKVYNPLKWNKPVSWFSSLINIWTYPKNYNGQRYNHCEHLLTINGKPYVCGWVINHLKWGILPSCEYYIRSFDDWLAASPDRIYEIKHSEFVMSEEKIIDWILTANYTQKGYDIAQIVNYITLRFGFKVFNDNPQRWTCWNTHGYFMGLGENNYSTGIDF
jgi:hypothetical protein